MRIQTTHGARMVRLSCRPRRDSDGTVLEYFVALEDVTERRRLEAAREEARRAHADLVRRMLTLQEAERRRIGRDIHDDLAQQVTALRMKLEWLSGLTPSDGELRGAVATVQEAAERVDQHIDFLLRDLRPAGLDELGLVGVLRDTVADWSATFGVPAEFHTSGLDGVRFPPEVEMHAYRIAQEALNNVHKHAAATSVRVVLERKQGPDVPRASKTTASACWRRRRIRCRPGARRGLGLLGMRERAAVIGGDLDVTSKPGKGTKVMLLLPA